ncbi:MAG: CoA pyrophosphatase [Devosiaceae bacterium]|nr:CoA pyrophosphatase [Devosiaceae bacterium]
MQKKQDILLHIKLQLLAQAPSFSDATELVPDWIPDVAFHDPPAPAAVLIALVKRETGIGVVFTLRSKGLRAHSGQIAFPGGKLDEGDVSPGAGALREAEEEIGLDQKKAKILGYMPSYLTGTNYLIIPVVAEVEGDAKFIANPLEVDEVFEIPLDFIIREESFSTFSIERGGRVHKTWQLRHDEHVIWGITANLIRNFRDLVVAGMDIKSA